VVNLNLILCSGVVQQEYFVAGTPVIAFNTGGLKDTVSEVCEERMRGRRGSVE
jgi:glycogen synthase